MRQSAALAALAILLVVGVVACGSDSKTTTSPTPTPTPTPQIPTVSGNYAGTATVQFPEAHATLTCPATATVTQSGSTVNIGTITNAGNCGFLLKLNAVTIDTSGSFPSGNSSYVDTCGTYNYSYSGVFGSNSLVLNISASSNYCLNYNYSVTMIK
jgi:hypothetical protein